VDEKQEEAKEQWQAEAEAKATVVEKVKENEPAENHLASR
jgi:hypothetical protein